MRRVALVGVVLLILIVAALAAAASQFSLSALPEPGRVEMYLATKARHYLVQKESRESIPAPPADIQGDIKEGDDLFGTECAACHGMSGHDPTDAGRWMYPRAADLTSREVQSYSDRELFWIIRNGIRLSGMPAFGKVETDKHIWDLVRYIQTLPVADRQH